MLNVMMNGLGPRDFVPTERMFIDLTVERTPLPPQPVAMRDARPLQADAGSEARFFADHGFVLLRHASAVKDWEPNVADPPDSEIARIYCGEIEAVIRERLLPGRRLSVWQHPVLVRRGEGTSTPQYGNGVHQDHALTPDDYEMNVAAFAGAEAAAGWRRRYEGDDVLGFMAINFWRTTNMDGPLLHMPLAICDPASVAEDDVIQFAMKGIAPGGDTTHQMGLRYSPDHLWYHYPGMTGDELLAFKIFQCMKSDAAPRLATCFHSAFEHPDTPEDAPRRQSCEHRVSVFLMKDES
ncbi:MAG TPA: CmcJ/NvfI family oxidoreductase [Allosphingosinicella sp.]|nr:CmcJ/NvfI family oxidoreductase [Allosphingosinicella sp.]